MDAFVSVTLRYGGAAALFVAGGADAARRGEEDDDEFRAIARRIMKAARLRTCLGIHQ